MDLSVIIVNYNVRHLLDQCLATVQSALRAIESEIIVIDNHSLDDSVDMIREKYPEVKLLANSINFGFSKANNQGLRIARGKFVLLLNPDTIVEVDTFRKSMDFMEMNPGAGALGVRMIDGTGSFLPESKRGFPSPRVSLFKMIGLSKLFPRSAYFNGYYQGHLSQLQTNKVDVLSGAFMFIRKSVLDEIGLLDENFFMYGEDIDLSFRINLAGYDNFYFPESTIIHYKGESTKRKSLNYVKTFYQSMIVFAQKHFSSGRAALLVTLLKGAIYIRGAVSAISRLWLTVPLFFLDLLFVFGGLYFIKKFWAQLYFGNQDYYTEAVLKINLPLYTIIWLIAIILMGGYSRKRFNTLTHLKGILVGTLVILALYGLLPLHLRSSRMIIILGSFWTFLSTLSLRYLLGYHKDRDGLGPRILVCGSKSEYDRVLNFIQRLDFPLDFSRRFSGSGEGIDDHKQDLDDLPEIVALYKIDEIIFCTKDLPVRDVMKIMAQVGPVVKYRIAPEHGAVLIGSKSKNEPSELHTLDLSFEIARLGKRRAKRTLDLILSIVAALFAPIMFFVVKSFRQYLRNCGLVLFGHVSWVGYCNPQGDSLPKLRSGILNPSMKYRSMFDSDRATSQINMLYAMEYGPYADLVIIFRNLKYLDRRPS